MCKDPNENSEKLGHFNFTAVLGLWCRFAMQKISQKTVYYIIKAWKEQGERGGFSDWYLVKADFIF